MGHSIGYIIGLLAGILVGVGVVALLFKLRVVDTTFDERQERARGQAYKYGFWTLLACLMLYGVSDEALGRWCDVLTGVMLCGAVAITVFAAVCIVKDAYLSLKEKPRTVMTLFAVITLLNLGIGVLHMLDGSVVEDGVLTAGAVNLICGVMVLVILVIYMVNYLLARREDGE